MDIQHTETTDPNVKTDSAQLAAPSPRGRGLDEGSSVNPQPSTLNPQLLHRLPGETPRAYSAFMTWFQLGHGRSLQAVADRLAEGLPTVKNWSSKFDWSNRLLSFNAGLLQQQASSHEQRQLKLAADWSERLNRFREQEWDAAQKLLSAAQCFLESFGDEDLSKMTLAQVSRALRISSDIARSSISGLEVPVASEPAMSPIQQQMLDALKRLSGAASGGAERPREPVCVSPGSATLSTAPHQP